VLDAVHFLGIFKIHNFINLIHFLKQVLGGRGHTQLCLLEGASLDQSITVSQAHANRPNFIEFPPTSPTSDGGNMSSF
jgi:hypothetical protein